MWIQGGMVILGSDLNFYLGACEIWRPMAKVDCLLNFLIRNLKQVGLLDIEPTKLTPTSTNWRIGEARIAKWLDGFLVLEDFIVEALGIWKWILVGGYFDHNMVFLEVALA